MTILLTTIQEVLRKEDIEGLLAIGAPSDEYSHEAQEISDALNSANPNNLTESDVIKIICQVWDRNFGPFLEADIKKRLSAFQQVAHLLLN